MGAGVTMRTYTVGVYGYHVPGLDHVHVSLEMVTLGLMRGFAALPHVRVIPISRGSNWWYNAVAWSDLPNCDVLVLHDCYAARGTGRDYDIDFAQLKAAGRIRYAALVLECPSNDVDWSYVYKPAEDPVYNRNLTVIAEPCFKEVLRGATRPKDDCTILLDHNITFHPTADYSAMVYEAVAPFAAAGYRVMQLGGGLGFEGRESPAPPWVERIPVRPYPEYLAATATAGTFIVTHSGSYNHGIIDMAARGTRVIARAGGAGGIPPSMITNLELPTYRSTEELRTQLAVPIDHVVWDQRIERCTDWTDFVRVMDTKLQEVL